MGANWLHGSIRILKKQVKLLQQQQEHRHLTTNHLLVAEPNPNHSYSDFA